MVNMDHFQLTEDSIHLYESRPLVIKSFVKADIINNVPMAEREYSVTVAPDSLLIRHMFKLPNGSVVATIEPAEAEYQKAKMNATNEHSVVVFNRDKVKAYETIDYEALGVGEDEEERNEIKSQYADGGVGGAKGNDMAVFPVREQCMLYTLDFKTGKVREKRYPGLLSLNEDIPYSLVLKANDKYILCVIDGCFSQEDKISGRHKSKLFVFDWELNPIKCFNFPIRGFLSDDGKAVYIKEYDDEKGVLTLQKADLDLP